MIGDPDMPPQPSAASRNQRNSDPERLAISSMRAGIGRRPEPAVRSRDFPASSPSLAAVTCGAAWRFRKLVGVPVPEFATMLAAAAGRSLELSLRKIDRLGGGPFRDALEFQAHL